VRLRDLKRAELVRTVAKKTVLFSKSVSSVFAYTITRRKLEKRLTKK